jgi:hypothetical protein
MAKIAEWVQERDKESSIMPSADGFIPNNNENQQRDHTEQTAGPANTPDKPHTLLGDNGYFSKINIQSCVKQKFLR